MKSKYEEMGVNFSNDCSIDDDLLWPKWERFNQADCARVGDNTLRRQNRKC